MLSDAIGFGLTLVPPVQWLIDAATAVVLVAVFGFRWPLLLALAIEVVPGLQVFPAWTLVVLALAGKRHPPPPTGREDEPSQVSGNVPAQQKPGRACK